MRPYKLGVQTLAPGLQQEGSGTWLNQYLLLLIPALPPPHSISIFPVLPVVSQPRLCGVLSGSRMRGERSGLEPRLRNVTGTIL